MIRTRTTTALAVMGLAALALSALPGTAQAATPTPAPAAVVSPAAAAADGYFYAYDGANKTGKYCKWEGDDSNWSSCSPGGGIRNQAGSIWNNGYAGAYEDVKVYWDNGDDGAWDGAWACIQNGYYYADLANWNFPNNATGGGGEVMNNNISAHMWANAC